jgi:UDP-N-acetylmuramoyl-L-alanyl-D-glutamate--2,6-diaminopimelate ligase
LFATIEAEPEYVDCGPHTIVSGLCVDSRALRAGEVFLAVRGAAHDGHRFVEQALRSGAAAVIVEIGCLPALAGPHVLVPDTSAVHADLAANAFDRPGDRLALAGVTGTNGKTTTAHLVGAMLHAAACRHVRLGTTGNWIVDREEGAGFTTPFPVELQAILARAVERGATHGVMEVSSHALAQGRVQPLRFAAVGFTSFSQDHLDFHRDMDEYLEAKCLLPRVHLRPGGVCVAAVDEKAVDEKAVDGQPAAARFLAAGREAGAQVWRASRGADPDAEIFAADVQFAADHTAARVRTPAGEAELRTPLIAAYNLDNALVALGLGLGLGIALDRIVAALATATGAPGRLQRVAVDGVVGPAVVVDYAHTPDAVERAIAAVRPICAGQLHVVLGCGGDRDPSKRPLMGAAAARGADVFWATSDNPRTEEPEQIVDDMLAGVEPALRSRIRRQVDRAQAIAGAIASAHDDDLILVAGKGHEDYQVLGTQKIHFDDREHAEAALRRR